MEPDKLLNSCPTQPCHRHLKGANTLLLAVVHAVFPDGQHSPKHSVCAGGGPWHHPLPLLFKQPEQGKDPMPKAPGIAVNSKLRCPCRWQPPLPPHVEQGKAHDKVVYIFSPHQYASPVCRWEDYVGQVEMATAIAAFKAEQGDDPKPTAPGIGDRKEMKKLQEVRLLNG